MNNNTSSPFRELIIQMLKDSAQKASQFYTEQEMQQLCQECWATGVPMALSEDVALSACLIPFNVPFTDKSTNESQTSDVVALFETRFKKIGQGWQAEQYLIDACDSLTSLARACMQTTFYAQTLRPLAKGEDLCKYADLLRYVGLHEDAIRWYSLSNIAGFYWGAYNVGEYYQKGKYVKQDLATARVWYERAAELGGTEALDRLKELG